MRILFVTATRIGDAVISTGVLQWLADRHPDARFTIACGRPAAPLFRAFPQLEWLLVVDKQRFSLHWLRLWASCIGTSWDIVVDLRGSGLAWCLLSSQRIVYRRRDELRHGVQALGALFGIDPPPPPVLWITADDERRAEVAMPSGGAAVLGVGPTANWRGKEWPAANFAELIRRLTAAQGILPGARVAIFGAASERAAAEPVLASVDASRRIDLVGAADLPTVAACLKRCALYIGNDSGLMHMAAAMRTPTLGLFGPGNELRYGPWGGRTAVVRTPLQPDQLMGPGFDHRTTGTLMESLNVDAVEAAAARLYTRTRELAV
jgi:heptosyltransferase III